MEEVDREVLHITDVKSVQAKINANSKEKALQATAAEKVLLGQASIKNGAVAEANSSVVNLAALNAKTAIEVTLRQVQHAEQVLCRSGSAAQEVAGSLRWARQSLEEGWQDAQTVSFANTGIKHTTIAMADVEARAIHAGIWMLRVQALSIDRH